MDIFKKYLTIWVALCVVVGVILGNLFPKIVATINAWEVSNVNLVIAVLIWFMVFPIMLKIDFSSIKAGKNPKKDCLLHYYSLAG